MVINGYLALMEYQYASRSCIHFVVRFTTEQELIVGCHSIPFNQNLWVILNSQIVRVLRHNQVLVYTVNLSILQAHT